ncbi:phospholipid carrier-dependent glycosyltransferase [Blastococcus haudaquaticus]|uniref:Dolichyl-phosphate-mannose-protein mannosyltransferase n=1 Tax=Blastococcus haudaquaticus TaxID=1938745 RepID=A0A286GE48_9ACTN|nr:phospholipid carrier-dependent glycosyltransferase [Blastococcus haudaquaticus]SOD93772.1 Dolichyl-phosphate-mannose-protein mannosyltransferase [Blastococcus haudaquaticus]
MPRSPEEGAGPGRLRRVGRGVVTRLGRAAVRHAGLLTLVGLGVALRVLATLAYVPAFSFADSFSYLEVARTGDAEVHRTWGYSGFLALVDGFLGFRYLVVVQHVLGVVAAVLVYALLQHRGVRRWVSCLAVAPLLLDGYVVMLEHYVMADSLYVLLLAIAVVLVLWHERPPWWAAGAAGAVLALGLLTRTVGLAVIGVVGLYLLVRLVRRTVGWTAVAATAVGMAAVVLPYVVWFHGHTGVYALSDYTGHFLYGRVAPFADCEKVDVPAGLRGLCPDGPEEERPNPDFFVWHPDSPANSGRYTDEDLREFSELVLRGQAMEYLGGTAGRTADYFLPGRTAGAHDSCAAYWWFPASHTHEAAGPLDCPAQLSRQGFELEPVEPVLRSAPADVLARYQDWVHTPDFLLGGLVVVGLSGLVPHRRRPRWRDNLDAVFCVVAGVALVAVPSATAVYDHRYGLPLLVVLPVAAALASRSWSRDRGAEAPAAAEQPPPVRPAVGSLT